MGLALLLLANGSYSQDILRDYFHHGAILCLNALPTALLALLFFGLTARTWSGFLLGGAVSLAFALGNFYKLQFRDDPLYFEDLLLLREAGQMTSGGYTLFADPKILWVILCLLLGTALLRLLAPGKLPTWNPRLMAALSAAVLMAAATPAYLSEDLYQSVRNFDHLNQWSPTQNYVSRGFWYPFLHSAGALVETPPPGYSKKEAEALLAAYPDEDIPADRKISIIALMREAYVDFSLYGIGGLDDSGYDTYHALEAESLTGELVTNCFAGGTVDTERCFLTGDWILPSCRRNTNSYAWYLRGQGYAIEGCHPYYQWFYNRRNINEHLGFERYRFLEGDFEALTHANYPEDSVLLPEIYKDFQAAAVQGLPYFSFSVNVQSHGPYDTETPAPESFLEGRYSDACKNAVNHYLSAIWDTDRQLAALVDKLRTDPEPVVLVTFGDHLPWMGDGNVFYEEMGIDIDAHTDEGFRRRYTTRYLIWANDAAKALLGHELQGEGPTISPCYLMGLVFEQLGWKGPGFLQAMEEFRPIFPVVTTNGRLIADGTLVGDVPEERQALYQRFLDLQYYWRHEFFYRNT